MFLASLISSFYLLVGASLVQPAIEMIQTRHLETPAGRTEFLNGDLKTFVSEADRLNEEIMALSAQIDDMNIENPSEQSQQEMVALGNDLNAKMTVMLEMLPMLQNAMQIDEDFQRIDAILSKQEPLEDAEKDVLMRIASLCDYVDSPDFKNFKNKNSPQ